MSRIRAGATALLLLVPFALAAPARAQEPGPQDPSTTSTSTTSTTAIPLDPGAILPPGDPSTTTTTSPEDPAAPTDAPSETVPPVSVTVPPRESPPGGAYAGQANFHDYPGRVVRVSSRTARARATETQAALDAAVTRRDVLGARRIELVQATARLAVEERAAIRAVEEAQLALEERAADAYVRGNLGPTRAILLSDDASQAAQRLELLEVVVEADEQAVRLYERARRAVDAEQLRTAEELARVASELTAAEEAVRAAELEHEFASRELAVFLNGGTLVIHGFTFPVGQPNTFGDSFGAPRMPGTEFEHWHEGTDIMAPFGTLLLAAERGVVLRIGTGGVLGGNTVWLRGESDTAYYYAHLSDFAPGLREGLVVDAGTVLGFVGDTGNARGGAPHLHFEVHPGGGAAVNPYPLLRVAADQPQPEPIWIQPPPPG
jgi:murein DD-endopeptidase MepM/ murein hydrolase activator NlpD